MTEWTINEHICTGNCKWNCLDYFSWLTDVQTQLLSDWQYGWLTNRLRKPTDWPTYWLTAWLTEQKKDLLSDERENKLLTDSLLVILKQLTDWPTDQSNDLLINWFADRSIDWLNVRLNKRMYERTDDTTNEWYMILRYTGVGMKLCILFTSVLQSKMLMKCRN